MKKDKSLIVPIFPLPLAICPGEMIPLHIFEERYKVLVNDCFDSHLKQSIQPFGISFLNHKNLHDIGCLVEIKKIVKSYADGQADILVQGTYRYQLIESMLPDDNVPYLRASINILEDTKEGNQQLETKLLNMIAAFSQLYDIEPSPAQSPVSYAIAHLCQMEPEQKQQLLELSSEDERLMFMVNYLDDYVKKIKTHKEIKRRVGSNGHFKNGQVDVL